MPEYENNHYIPQFILRRFGSKINRYNVLTGKIICKGSTLNAFSEKKIYPEWLEKMLSDLESRIANLIDNKVLKVDDNVSITREENWLIKKYFTVATLRVPDTYIRTVKHIDKEQYFEMMGMKEKKIENETNEDYLYRTLKVVLEANSLDEIYKHDLVTYEACKWATLFHNCFISIWDSKNSREDFIITDNGMNCEHDKSRFIEFNFDGKTYKNDRDEMLKKGYIIKKAFECNEQDKKFIYFNLLRNMDYVHANYYIFAVSNTRTISLINPFYRLYYDQSFIDILKETPNVWPSVLSREALEANTYTYKKIGEMNKEDIYHYKIKNLSLDDVIIINNMMLDRVYEWMGFDNSSKISRSINVYLMMKKQFQRKNYYPLKEYLYNLGCEFPKIKKYEEIHNKMCSFNFTKEEIEYIKYFYNSIIHK